MLLLVMHSQTDRPTVQSEVIILFITLIITFTSHKVWYILPPTLRNFPRKPVQSSKTVIAFRSGILGPRGRTDERTVIQRHSKPRREGRITTRSVI